MNTEIYKTIKLEIEKKHKEIDNFIKNNDPDTYSFHFTLLKLQKDLLKLELSTL